MHMRCRYKARHTICPDLQPILSRDVRAPIERHQRPEPDNRIAERVECDLRGSLVQWDEESYGVHTFNRQNIAVIPCYFTTSPASVLFFEHGCLRSLEEAGSENAAPGLRWVGCPTNSSLTIQVSQNGGLSVGESNAGKRLKLKRRRTCAIPS